MLYNIALLWCHLRQRNDNEFLLFDDGHVLSGDELFGSLLYVKGAGLLNEDPGDGEGPGRTPGTPGTAGTRCGSEPLSMPAGTMSNKDEVPPRPNSKYVRISGSGNMTTTQEPRTTHYSNRCLSRTLETKAATIARAPTVANAV